MGIGTTYRLDASTLFLDSPALEKWVAQEQVKPLTRFGAILRRTARGSIKVVAPTKSLLDRTRSDDPKKKARALKTLAARRARVSDPGKPPLSHAARDAKISIRNIQFAFDPQTRTVVAGPLKLNAKGVNVPETLERGGTATVYRVKQAGVWRSVGKRTYSRWRGGKQQSRVTIKPRPTMGLALAANESKIPQQFRSRV